MPPQNLWVHNIVNTVSLENTATLKLESTNKPQEWWCSICSSTMPTSMATDVTLTILAYGMLDLFSDLPYQMKKTNKKNKQKNKHHISIQNFLKSSSSVFISSSTDGKKAFIISESNGKHNGVHLLNEITGRDVWKVFHNFQILWQTNAE